GSGSTYTRVERYRTVHRTNTDLQRSGAGAVAHEVGVVGQLRDLPPQIFVVAEGQHRVPDLLEVGTGLAHLGVELERGLQRGVHHRLRERAQRRAARDRP